MDKGTTLDRMRAGGIIAVLRSPSYQAALDTTAALLAAGLAGIEVTFSTPEALKVVRALRDRYGDDIILGVGTLTDPAQVAASRDAGAEFLVSPHVNAELAAAMAGSGLVAVIGALTPSEVVQAMKHGADVVKIFPGSLVGPGYLKALRGPFGDLLLMPTGGVTPENVPQWFAAGAFAVAAGGSLCPADLVQRGEYAEITRRAAQFVAAVARVKQERDG